MPANVPRTLNSPYRFPLLRYLLGERTPPSISTIITREMDRLNKSFTRLFRTAVPSKEEKLGSYSRQEIDHRTSAGLADEGKKVCDGIWLLY